MGSLGAAAPKPVFAYFCLAAKVGRARGHETSPPFGKTKRKWGVDPVPRARGRETSRLFGQTNAPLYPSSSAAAFFSRRRRPL